jgi:transposase
MIGKRIPFSKKQNNEKYIDELDKKDYDRLQSKTIVSIDPNKGDLLYCVDDVIKERNQFRYTQDQRRKETKQKKYRDIIQELKKKKKINKKNVIELETEISKHNKRTLDIKKFKEYLKKKNEVNKKLFEFYEKEIFRKLKLNGYINRLKSEQIMISRFTEKFGEPENVVAVIGDWEQKQHMKYKEPTKGKGFRELFRKSGFEVYLVDEHKTSCKCSICEGDCERFRICENPRPWKKGTITRHGLVRCKTCKVLWNRDENSSCNIFKVARSAINKIERPKYLCRTSTLRGAQCVSSAKELTKEKTKLLSG